MSGQTVHENLKMSSAMLSRFDLIFLLLDQPDEALDHSLSEHVLALHSGEPLLLRLPLEPMGECSASQSTTKVVCLRTDKPLTACFNPKKKQKKSCDHVHWVKHLVG